MHNFTYAKSWHTLYVKQRRCFDDLFTWVIERSATHDDDTTYHEGKHQWSPNDDRANFWPNRGWPANEQWDGLHLERRLRALTSLLSAFRCYQLVSCHFHSASVMVVGSKTCFRFDGPCWWSRWVSEWYNGGFVLYSLVSHCYHVAV